MNRISVLRVLALLTFATGAFPFVACGHGGSGGTGNVGNNGVGGNGTTAGGKCMTASQCFVGIQPSTIKGTVACLTQVPSGYCTHTCTQDSDCCAVKGECPLNKPEVCASFESTGQKYCFLSCDPAVVGTVNNNTYCSEFANASFGCRSTGGGNQNRQVCLP